MYYVLRGSNKCERLIGAKKRIISAIGNRSIYY